MWKHVWEHIHKIPIDSTYMLISAEMNHDDYQRMPEKKTVFLVMFGERFGHWIHWMSEVSGVSSLQHLEAFPLR